MKIKLFEEFKINNDFEKIIDLLENGYSYNSACVKLNLNRDSVLKTLTQQQKRLIDEYRAFNMNEPQSFKRDWNEYHRNSGELDKLTYFEPLSDDYLDYDTDGVIKKENDEKIRNNDIELLKSRKDNYDSVHYIMDSIKLDYNDGIKDGMVKLLNELPLRKGDSFNNFLLSAYFKPILDKLIEKDNKKMIKELKRLIKKIII